MADGCSSYNLKKGMEVSFIVDNTLETINQVSSVPVPVPLPKAYKICTK